jgi:hypothetical protein
LLDISDFTLKDDDLSATYKVADQISQEGQKQTRRLLLVELSCLTAAGASGVTAVRIGASRLDVLAILGCIAFVAALVAGILRGTQKPESQWYAGRAAAESIRTLAWRYSVAGDPFPPSTEQAASITSYLGRIREVINEIDDLPFVATSPEDSEITTKMNLLRASEINTRKQVYAKDRIQDQINWYTKRSKSHRKSANLYLTATTGASILGITLGILRIIDLFDADFLGFFAGAATAIIAWNQMNQHRTLVSSYALAARELAIIRERIPLVVEDSWPTFVSDSEDAISREHTLWLARNGHPHTRRRIT